MKAIVPIISRITAPKGKLLVTESGFELLQTGLASSDKLLVISIITVNTSLHFWCVRLFAAIVISFNC